MTRFLHVEPVHSDHGTEGLIRCPHLRQQARSLHVTQVPPR
jgi:hypothetical protein